MISIVTPPASEPLSLTTAKAHLRVEHTADDALISDLIVSVRQQAEAFTGRAFITQTLRLLLDSAPSGATLELPRPPLLSLTHVKSYDDADNATTMSAANYFVDTISHPGRLILRTAGLWPVPSRAAHGLEVQYVAGYGPTAADVPHTLRQGMLCHLAHLYENRGDAEAPRLPEAAASLYMPFRLLRGLS